MGTRDSRLSPGCELPNARSAEIATCPVLRNVATDDVDVAALPISAVVRSALTSAVGDARSVGSVPGGECFDRIHRRLESDRMEQVEGMLGAGQLGIDDRLLRDTAQPLDERPRTLDWRVRVVVTMHNEARATS